MIDKEEIAEGLLDPIKLGMSMRTKSNGKSYDQDEVFLYDCASGRKVPVQGVVVVTDGIKPEKPHTVIALFRVADEDCRFEDGEMKGQGVYALSGKSQERTLSIVYRSLASQLLGRDLDTNGLEMPVGLGCTVKYNVGILSDEDDQRLCNRVCEELKYISTSDWNDLNEDRRIACLMDVLAKIPTKPDSDRFAIERYQTLASTNSSDVSTMGVEQLKSLKASIDERLYDLGK